MTLSRKIGADIRADLLAGMSVKSIAKKYGCSQATVSYHRGKVGLPKHPDRPAYDWDVIDDAIKTRGLTWKQIELEFGPVHRAIQKAVIRGQIREPVNGTAQPFPLSEVAVENSTYKRGNLKRRLLASGELRNHCYNRECLLHGQDNPTWAGKPLVLQLDHINGVSNDHRLENLQMLCANCHGQTHSFAGRNKRYKTS
jgi:hypothetical protein